MTIDQLRRLHPIGGKRNAQKTLRQMESEGYINTFFADRSKVTYLGKKGREETGVTIIRKKTLAVRHFLLRNEIFIRYCPDKWRNEPELVADGEMIRPDAAFSKGGREFLIEIDITQSMAENRNKMRGYIALKQKMGDKFPEIMIVTTSEFRRNEWEKMLGKMKGVVMTADDLR
ncbi:Replication-relaxation [Marininema mesophilum]|uniref:Replication-relaxation n=1 Tax=Marininema mesophilum TaxID=1048340 RepID=A0A1H3BSU2_9BACL|nr:Replication-relaxation [Marininema mesophilum]